MKRVLCGALAVILAIGCLTGCQEGNDLNSTNESSQAVSSKPNPADKKESIDTSSRKNSSSASKKSSSPDNVHQDPVAESQISDIQKPEKPTQIIPPLLWLCPLLRNPRLANLYNLRPLQVQFLRPHRNQPEKLLGRKTQ